VLPSADAKDAVPPHMLPPLQDGSHRLAKPQENNAWNDLVTKIKTLILLSFDLRVSQYEEDIREGVTACSPGWNFVLSSS